MGSPQIEHDEDAFPGLALESHSGTVKWVAPIQLAPGVKPETVKIEGKVNMQLCDAKGCAQPKDYPFAAVLRPDVKAVTVARRKAPRKLRIASRHRPTPSSGLRQVSLRPTHPCRDHAMRRRAVSAPSNAVPAVANAVQPAETVKAANEREGQVKSIGCRSPMPRNCGELVGPDFDVEQIRENVRKEDVGLGIMGAIFAGFLGGLILNIMPCVLPVIGLKILSFVEQAGHNRRKAFMLNVWYSAGLLAVFFILASLAVGPQHLGWGELFGKTWFTITLAAVVFVMALSFMGVWEVPLPTFLGSGKTGELAAQGGRRGGLLQRRIDHASGHAVQRPVPGPCPGLGHGTTGLADLCRVSFRGPGHGQSVSARGGLSRTLAIPAQARRVDGDLQDLHGFRAHGHGGLSPRGAKPQYVVPTVGLLFGLSFMCWWIGRISPVADFMAKLAPGLWGPRSFASSGS